MKKGSFSDSERLPFLFYVVIIPKSSNLRQRFSIFSFGKRLLRKCQFLRIG